MARVTGAEPVSSVLSGTYDSIFHESFSFVLDSQSAECLPYATPRDLSEGKTKGNLRRFLVLLLPLCNRQTHRIMAVSLCKDGGTTSRSGFPAQSSSSKVITAPSACGRVFSRLFCSRRIRSAFRWASDSGISWILFSERINSCAYTISKRAALHSQESGAA